ncbi:hypothetical protein [Methylobacterium nigriterrae]|uniref:hypothetical protein n=1 Tax=Methylobacterium nigriterrae TaxID=3127512 RepID=UPI0030141198
MLSPTPRESEIGRIRHVLAGLAVETELVRLSRSLSRKYRPDQPRAPAGQPDGGRWVSEDGGPGGDGAEATRDPATADPVMVDPALVDPALVGPGRWTSLASEDDAGAGERSRERTLLEDGSEVLSIRIHAGPRAGDEEHTVTGPDGESRVFETSGDTQTIRDGATGEVLGRSVFTATGAEPAATLQPAFLPALPLVVPATVELAAILLAVLAARNGGFGSVLGLSAQEYKPSEDFKQDPAIWVGTVDLDDLNRACPRAEEIQAETDRVAEELRRSGLPLTPQRFGDILHYKLADIFNRKGDPNLRAEVSVAKDGKDPGGSKKGSVRLDLYERTVPGTVCVYDYKTGRKGLEPSRALYFATVAKRMFPETTRIIIIQVRPRR